MTHSKFLMASAFVIVLFATTASTQETASGPRQLVERRPLAEAASEFQEARGKIVTYEEPALTWGEDLEEIPGKSGTKGYLYPKEWRISIPAEVGSEPDLGIALNKTIGAYHNQTTGTRFQILTSKWGYHIVPLQVHDSNGALVPAGSLLDAQIYVAAAERTARGQLDAFGAAVTAATGMALDVTAFPTQSGGFDRMFRARPESFSWGAENVVARDALIDLLSRSATSLSWRLNCQASRQADARFCILNLMPVTVAITNASGQPEKRALWFDRCGDCPPLQQVAPPPAH